MKSKRKSSLVMSVVYVTLGLMALLLGFNAKAQAQAPLSPTGLWQSIDDATGKPRAQIRITRADNRLTGRIVASSTTTVNGVIQVCERCTDDRKNQPLIGMEIIRNMQQKTQQKNDETVWTGGEILDPDKGSSYRLQLTLLDNGKQLQVRGYIGLFFRNQTWTRLE